MKKKKRRDVDIWKGYFRRFTQCQEGRQFEVKSFGLCQWTKISFWWSGADEFYKLTRAVCAEIEDANSERREFFRGRLTRKYVGPQNCFLEFCDFLQNSSRHSMKEKSLQAAQSLNLDAKTVQKYITFYKQCFCK